MLAGSTCSFVAMSGERLAALLVDENPGRGLERGRGRNGSGRGAGDRGQEERLAAGRILNGDLIVVRWADTIITARGAGHRPRRGAGDRSVRRIRTARNRARAYAKDRTAVGRRLADRDAGNTGRAQADGQGLGVLAAAECAGLGVKAAGSGAAGVAAPPARLRTSTLAVPVRIMSSCSAAARDRSMMRFLLNGTAVVEPDDDAPPVLEIRSRAPRRAAAASDARRSSRSCRKSRRSPFARRGNRARTRKPRPVGQTRPPSAARRSGGRRLRRTADCRSSRAARCAARHRHPERAPAQAAAGAPVAANRARSQRSRGAKWRAPRFAMRIIAAAAAIRCAARDHSQRARRGCCGCSA